jgi:PIN domain nuclease of toxin-antitoxin system
LRLLLDTHVALWYVTLDPRLSPLADRQISDRGNDVVLSSVVVWEVAVKRSLGKLRAPLDLVERFLEGGARPLPVTLEHAAGVEVLPWHHRDPFDRLLIAQAKAENALLVTGDASLSAYDVPVLW